MKSSKLEEELQDSSNSFGFKVMYTFGFGPKPPLEGQLPSSDLPSYGPDGKGLFGIGGLSKGVSSQTGGSRKYTIAEGVFDICKNFSGISSQPASLTMHLKKDNAKSPSWKIYSEDGGAPMIRLDPAHHELPTNHLQFGAKFYSGRNGDEAVDIFVDVFTKSKKTKLF